MLEFNECPEFNLRKSSVFSLRFFILFISCTFFIPVYIVSRNILFSLTWNTSLVSEIHSSLRSASTYEREEEIREQKTQQKLEKAKQISVF